MAIQERATFAMPQGQTAAPAQERVAATLWANVGLMLPITQDDGTIVEEFVSFPIGIPLDTQEPMVPRGRTKSWLHMVQTKNALLKWAQDQASKMEPGTGSCNNNLQVQLFRKNDAAAEVDPAENTMLAAMSERLGA